MPVSREELDRFHQFAASQLGQADPPATLQECLNQWRQSREIDETLADLRQSQAELDAGLGVPLDEAVELVRRELGLPSICWTYRNQG